MDAVKKGGDFQGQISEAQLTPSLITLFLISLLRISAFSSPRAAELCPEIVIPGYEASSPRTVIVGETLATRQRLWVLRSWGELKWVWRIWFRLLVTEPRATMPSTNSTYDHSTNSFRDGYIHICRANKRQVNFYGTLALRASTSDLSTLLFVLASPNCWLASVSCLYRDAFSPLSCSTWEYSKHK